MTYAGLISAEDKAAPHLGGNITCGDPFTWCSDVWNYVIDRFAIKSAMDLGSGSGNTAMYFSKKGVATIAVDGFDQNIRNSVYPTIKQDLTQGSVFTVVDFVHCQEVVEHIEEKYLDNLLNSLMCGRIILLTHALPGQDGYHHVNLQAADYWIGHLCTQGCSFLDEDTRRIRELAARQGARYMAATGLLFSNNKR